MTKLISVNPSTKEKLGEVAITTKKQVLTKIAKAKTAFSSWGYLELNKRIELLSKVVNEIEKTKDELAILATKEMGMPITDSKYDISDALHYFKWYLENAAKYLSPEVTYEDDKVVHRVYYEPRGVVAAITPWNYPTSNVIWAVGQSLVCGNTVVYKTSEENPLFGKMIEEIFTKHLPNGVFQEVYGDGNVGKLLVSGDIDFIAFTGSTEIGRYLYKVAAKKFIGLTLELGGSAPGIVFEDADLQLATENIYFNRYGNCGQTCDGLKRLIIHKDVADKLVTLLKEKLAKIKVGNALNEDIEIGPLVSEKQFNRLSHQVEDATRKGAKVVVGGKKINSLNGYFFEPTVLTNIRKNMLVWKEEVFGPVLPVITFEEDNEAILLANDTVYGLGSYVYTKDLRRAKDIAHQIKAGMVSINGESYVQPYNPFGGCKMSGFGREHGKFGFRELTQVKVVSSNK